MKALNKLSLKAVIIILPIAIFLSAAAVLIGINFDKIFVFAEKNKLFCNEMAYERVDDVKTFKISLEDIEADERFVTDQSLMLVNKDFLLESDFVPKISEYKDTTVYMNDCMLSAYAKLSADIMEKFDKKLYVASDFRDADEQEQLYLDDPLTATAVGASEHQTGLALDVYVAYFSGDRFIKSPVGRYVNRHSWEYGFIIRYPSFGEEITGIRFEPWHIRYVGQPHASIIYNNYLTLEEYVLSMEIGVWYESNGYLISRQALTQDRELEIPIEFNSCTVSPDNTGYYIVTAK